MNLAIGMLVRENLVNVRYRITSFSLGLVTLRRVEYHPSKTNPSVMEWTDTEDTRDMFRANFEVMFTPC